MIKKYNYAKMFLNIMDDMGIKYEKHDENNYSINGEEYVLSVMGQLVLKPWFSITHDGSFILKGSGFENTIIDDYDKLKYIVFYEFKETLYEFPVDFIEV